MQANDITRERLRRLAETRPPDGKVLSVFLNLDPREFGIAPARSTEIRSMLDRASRAVRDAGESLSHEERMALRADLERLQTEINDRGLDFKGAHGVAVFASSPADLFEVLKLSEPVEHDPVIADTPFIAPLTAIGPPERWCVVLVNRRTASLSRCAEATVSVTGFSTSAGTPRATQSSAIPRCSALGDATIIPSGISRSSKAR